MRSCARANFPTPTLHALDDERNIGRPVADEEGAGDDGGCRSRMSRLRFLAGGSRVFLRPRGACASAMPKRRPQHAWVIDGSSRVSNARRMCRWWRPTSTRPRCEGVGARGLVALPGSASVALATALAPLHAVAGLVRAEVATYQAVSGSGRAAVDELAGETVAMLSGKQAARACLRPPDRLQRHSAGRCIGEPTA